MRLAVLGDIHANHKALEAVLAHIYEGEYDGLIFVGDYVTDCPYPRKTIKI
ncbi:MAG: metallophosphatase family protein, partial [Oscillospiraceae bacterium]|nr:metallophosphatase family protein [Oscillospiraceae bacterium]